MSLRAKVSRSSVLGSVARTSSPKSSTNPAERTAVMNDYPDELTMDFVKHLSGCGQNEVVRYSDQDTRQTDQPQHPVDDCIFAASC